MWQIDQTPLKSRLLLGTARYPSPEILCKAIEASGAEIITVSLRRESSGQSGENRFWDYIKNLGCHLLPNTAGCRSAQEAVTTAQMAREVFETNWIKLEVIGDDYTLQPNPLELVGAAERLIKDGFTILPYCTEDLVICQRLVDVGCQILMPWASPIGSAQGLLNPFALRALRKRLPNITLIVDAGIGAPSHALQAMELGYDAVLLNSAVSLSPNPVKMASAFRLAVESGRLAHEAGILPKRDLAEPSTPTIGQPFWQNSLQQPQKQC